MDRDLPAAAGGVLDLPALARSGPGPIPVWLEASEDLHMNVLSFAPQTGVAAHVNAEVDVLLVAIAGQGTITIDGVAHAIQPLQAVLIPKGARRAITAGAEGLSYLSCHRRRSMLWPGPRGAHRSPPH